MISYHICLDLPFVKTVYTHTHTVASVLRCSQAQKPLYESCTYVVHVVLPVHKKGAK